MRIAATSGSKARESVERSPGSERPISPTIHSGPARQVDDGHRKSDLAVLVARSLLDGEAARDSIAAVKSFVVVFPAEPVIAARRKPIFFFAATPRLRSASTDCGTITAGKPAGRSSARRSPSSAPAPRAAASLAKSWPSTRAPRIATKRSPGRTRRESTATPESAAAPSARAPAAAATSASVKFMAAPRSRRRPCGRRRGSRARR